MDSDAIVYCCALSKVFAYKFAAGRHLAEAFGGPAGVFAARRDELTAVLSQADAYVDQLLDPALLEWARRETDWAWAHGIRLLPLGEPDYPQRLAECEDAPLMLYYKGTVSLNGPRILAVVGTRKATWYGRETVRRIISRLADLEVKPLIVSGLALGIDGCAHAAALECGLETVGVLPCGIDEIYPRQHQELALRMAGQGALLTDFPRSTAPVAFTFLRRNRIIAGLADATLLAESYRKGGGLITVSLAESYNREIFAVPGRLTDNSFEGCNHLIAKQTAMPIADADTLPSALGWLDVTARRKRPSPIRPDDPPMRRECLRLLQARGALSVEELAAQMRIESRQASVLLLELEMEGRVKSDGTDFFLTL